MIDVKILQYAMLVGSVLQVALVIVAHFIPWVAIHALLFGGMMISATMGYVYAMDSAAGYQRGALGGAIAGGVCALIGIAFSILLGDTPAYLIASGTGIAIFVGAIGGVFGQLATRVN